MSIQWEIFESHVHSQYCISQYKSAGVDELLICCIIGTAITKGKTSVPICSPKLSPVAQD